MASLIPISNTRVTGLLTRQRLTQQANFDQLAMFRLQNQISTGQRIALPSEDAPAALRAISLQRLLDRKNQLQTNVSRGLSYLAATDTALNDTAALLGDIRGSALGVSGTTVSDVERSAVVAEVNRAIEQMVQAGNRTFRGRYLFAGSQTNVKPYVVEGSHVVYRGNEKEIRNFSDIDVLYASNSIGQNVFGGLSSDVLGGAQLQPHVSADTLLSSLRGGRGISPNGALTVSDGAHSVVVDLTDAVTLGDVARLLEGNPPSGRQLSASISGNGLVLALDNGGGGILSVTEAGSGNTARELGLLQVSGSIGAPLVGGDLDPALTLTTRIDDLLGAKARGRILSAGNNNDLWIEATANGAAANGNVVQFVDHELLAASGGVAVGAEFAEFDPAARASRASLKFSGFGNDLVVTANALGSAFNNVAILVNGATGLGDAANAVYDGTNKRLVITVDDAGATSIQQVVNAINATGAFTANHDNSVEAAFNGATLVSAADIANVKGNTGNSGGSAGTLYVHVAAGQTTANHAVAAINAEGTFRASLDAVDNQVVAQAGTGVVTLAASTTVAGGSGTTFDKTSGLRIVNVGRTTTIDFSTAETIEDLLNALNGSEAAVHAEINADKTGIDVRSRASGADFQIGENGGQTAAQLGIRSLTATTRLHQFNYGAGVNDEEGIDFTLVVDNGAGGTVELPIDVAGAESLQDILDLVNNHPLNNAGPVAVRAELASVGNGVRIVDVNGRPLTIRADSGSHAAEELGLLSSGQLSASSPTGAIQGADRYFLESESVFTTLSRLRDALIQGDLPAIDRAIAQIDVDLDRVTFARAETGARQQGLDVTKQNLEDENVQLRAALSDEIDVDLVEAISELTGRQAALQASLRTTASILQLSLLDFI